MDWIYGGETFTSEMIGEAVGFVYLITNITNGRKYIGKKLFTFASTKQVKGKKKRVRVESDWKDYFGSSDELKADVAALGDNNFTREILYLCMTKGECNYLEAREQFDRRVLEREDYYNGQIQCRIHQTHIKKMVERLTS